MNYVELTQAIVDYTANYEQTFVNNIKTFVSQTEDRVYQSVEFPALRKTATSTTTSGSKYLAAPSDFLAAFSLSIKRSDNNYTFLLDKDVNWMAEAYRNDLVTGTPAYYGLFDAKNFVLGPTPDAAYYIECNYFYKPTSIVTAGTSWLGDNMPSVLLYGSLLEAYTFMKGEPDIMTLYTGRYEAALANLRNLGEGRNRVDAYRSGQDRVKEKA